MGASALTTGELAGRTVPLLPGEAKTTEHLFDPLLVAVTAAVLGLVNSFRMMRLPDPRPSSAAEGMALG